MTVPRVALVRRGLKLNYTTLGYISVEGSIAIGAGLAAGLSGLPSETSGDYGDRPGAPPPSPTSPPCATLSEEGIGDEVRLESPRACG
jgi:hypothetical protein